MKNQGQELIKNLIEKINETLTNHHESFTNEEKQSLKDAKSMLEGLYEESQASVKDNVNLTLVVLNVVKVIMEILSELSP